MDTAADLIRAAAATAWLGGAAWLVTTVASAFAAAWRDTREPAAAREVRPAPAMAPHAEAA